MLLPCYVWHGLLSFSLHLPLLLSKVIDKVGTYYEFGWDGMVPRLDEVDAEDGTDVTPPPPAANCT